MCFFVAQLLKAGAQVHHVSKDGRSTALHEAVLRSHADLVDMLLRASANPFLENGSGKHVVFTCCSSNTEQKCLVRGATTEGPVLALNFVG